MALNLSRDAKLYVSTVERVWTAQNTFEVRILDGFSFSQGTESTTITVDETGERPVRGQKMFNTALNPVDLSFSTYIRPTLQGGVVTAAERILWEAFVSKGNGNPADPFNDANTAGLEPSTDSTVDGLIVDFDDSNEHDFLGVFFYLDLGSVKYKISNAAMSEASLDFDLAGIAMLAWTGQAETMEEAEACQFPEVFQPIPDCAEFITNQLSTLSMIGPYNSAQASFQVTTPGSLAELPISVTIGDAVAIPALTPVDPTAEEYAQWFEETFCGVEVSCIAGQVFTVSAKVGNSDAKLLVEATDLSVLGVSSVEDESSLTINLQNFRTLVKTAKAYNLQVSMDSTETTATGALTLTGTADAGEVSTALVGPDSFSTAAASGGETASQIATLLAASIDANGAYNASAVGPIVNIEIDLPGAAGNVTKLQYLTTGSVTGLVTPFSGGGEEGWIDVIVDIGVSDTLVDVATELASVIGTAVSETLTFVADDANNEIVFTVGSQLADRIVLQDDSTVAVGDRFLTASQSSWRSGLADEATGVTAFLSHGEGGDRYYSIPLTGGSLSISNNITYLTPEELGVVNIPIGYFAGTRAVTATFDAYLRTGEEGQTGQLLSDLLNALTEVSTSFQTWLTVGGSGNDTTVEFYFPSLHLTVPTINTAEVISTSIEGTGQATDGLTGTDEVIITYRTK